MIVTQDLEMVRLGFILVLQMFSGVWLCTATPNGLLLLWISQEGQSLRIEGIF